MHPQRVRAAAGAGVMMGRQRQRRMKAGFLGPLLGLAAPLLGSILPNIFERVFPRKEGQGIKKATTKRLHRRNKGGLGAPYGGSKMLKNQKSKLRGFGAFQPGPLA